MQQAVRTAAPAKLGDPPFPCSLPCLVNSSLTIAGARLAWSLLTSILVRCISIANLLPRLPRGVDRALLPPGVVPCFEPLRVDAREFGGFFVACSVTR